MINTIWSYVSGGVAGGINSLSPVGARNRTSTPPPVVKPAYSLAYLQAQIDDLIAIAGSADSPRTSINSGSTDRLVELIRAIAETLLWGDQNEHDSLMFDYFAEKGVAKIFVALLNSPTIPSSNSMFSASTSGNRLIKVQLLQTMSLLLLNVKRQTSLYFLFSNNSINHLINNNNNLDFSDEEILSYFVTLMKSVALRLSGETVQFFISEKNSNYFPMFNQSLRFFDHHDRMIRIAVRTITLSIFKLYSHNTGLQQFIHENSGGYFSLLACQLRDLWYLLDRTLAEQTATPSTLEMITGEMIDQLEFLAEIERLEIQPLSDMLKTKLSTYALDPVLLVGLHTKNTEERSPVGSEGAAPLTLNVSLFVLSQMVQVSGLSVTNDVLREFLQSASSSVTAHLKAVPPVTFACYVTLFRQLVQEETLQVEVSEFGLRPPKSVQMVILTAQALSRSTDCMNIHTLRTTLFFLRCFLVDPTIEDEFKRPVRITIVDSFKAVTMRILLTLQNSLLRSPSERSKANRSRPLSPSTADMDYTIIDLIEDAMAKATSLGPTELNVITPHAFNNSVSDPQRLVKSEHISDEFRYLSSPDLTVDSLRMFLIFTHFVLTELCPGKPGLTAVPMDALYNTRHQPDADEEINSPPTPPPEYIESESLATDRKSSAEDITIPDTVKEMSSVDLGKRDRIVCSHINGLNGKATRYLLLDKWRLLLVSPDLTRPGFATVRTLEQLRSIKRISVRKDDQRILVVTPVDSRKEEIAIGFEDAKRCHLALMHLETTRIEIRKDIFYKLEAWLKSLIHCV